MGGIYCKYKISNPKELYNQNDEIEGIFYIESEEEKDKKLKMAEIHCVEVFEFYQTTRDQQGNVSAQWVNRRKKLEKYPIAKGEVLRSGETKEYPFKITLPKKWKIRQGGNFNDWHLALMFVKKTGLVSSRGSEKDDAYYVIPVKGSQRQSYTSSTTGEEEEVAKSDDMKFCSECGKKIKRTAKFCEHCGAQP